MNIEIKRKAKHPFTIIEILCVLFILAIAAASIGIKGPALLRHERFENGVEAIFDQIVFAQEIMLLYQTDLSLTLQVEKKGILANLNVASKDVKNAFKTSFKPVLIKGIDAIFFNNEKQKIVTINFLAEDCVVTKGLLSFGNSEKRKHISLPGFPSSPSVNKIKKDETPSKAIYPQEVLSPV